MSDRVTNVEIEDVLTSIRKLVADGEWIRQRAAEANAAKGAEELSSAAEAVDDAGKFVLTPALRVIESRAEVRGKSESLLRFRRAAEPEVMDNEVLWTPVAPEAETAAEEQAEDQLEAIAESLDAADADAEAEEETSADPETISDILEMFDGEEEADEELTETDEAEPSGYQSLGAAIAELEAAVGSDSEDWEPDGSETVLNDFTTPLRAVGGMEMPDIVDDEDGIDDPQPEISGEIGGGAEEDESSMEMISSEAPLDLAFFARPRERFVEEKLEEALAETGEDESEGRALSFVHNQAGVLEEETAPEEATDEEDDALDALAEEPEAAFEDVAPGEAGEDDATEIAEAMIDQISEAIAGTAAVEAANAIGDELDEELAAYLSEETALDEDMLRDLITQVVRSELEGELGERMTRNIRKLVRREVFSILESREAE
jgi:hypothetical protein